MGWLSRLLGREEVRAVSYQDVWGSGRDWIPSRARSVDTALTMVPVYAATRLLSDSVASLPIHTFRKSGDTRVRIQTPQLFDDPSVFGSRYDWLFRAMASLTLKGNAYGLITSLTDQGFPRSVEWLDPDNVHVDEDETTGRPQWFWRGRRIDSQSLIHIPNYVLAGRLLGLSPIAAYAVTTETGLMAQEFGRDWFKNGSIPSAVLESDKAVSEEASKVIKERFKAAARSREPVVLGTGAQYKPITVSPNESQFLATIKATRNDIAAIYGIPAERIGGETGGSLTYNNREQDSLDLVTWTLRSYLTRLEAAFDRMVPRGQFVRFNIDALVRADLRTRYEAHSLALRDGWMSKDEVRSIEDMPPLPDGQGAGFAPTGQDASPFASRRMPDRVEVRQTGGAEVDDAAERIARFFALQGSDVTARDGKIDEIFDVDHWNRVLAPILLSIGLRVSERAGRDAMRQLGLDPSAYDVERTTEWMTAHAEGVAGGINETTRDQVAEALEDDDDVSHVFEVAQESRASMTAQTAVTAAAGFGVREAAAQAEVPAVKTWRATSPNPRPSHESLDGETVPVGETFSNGARWPGDSLLEPDERAGCTCDMTVSAV